MTEGGVPLTREPVLAQRVPSDAPTDLLARRSRTGAAWRREARRKPLGIVSVIILVVVIVIAIFAPFVSPYDPLFQDSRAVLAAPGGAHLFGTDQLGRDLLSRL